MGNRPKPTKLKLLQGNPGKRKLNDREPRPDGRAPECPSHLDATAKRIWRRTVERLEALGLVAELDEAVLALFCQTYSTWLQLTRDVKREGIFIKRPVFDAAGQVVIGGDGEPVTEWVKNPKQVEARLLLTQIRASAAEFGMTPAARSRLTVDIPGGEEDEMEKWEREKEKRDVG